MKRLATLLLLLITWTLSYADQITVDIYKADASKEKMGTVVFQDSDDGLLILPNLASLPPGLHGFHLHEKANCGSDGMDAGGHYDPKETKHHAGPYGEGHFGDLPLLFVDTDGKANIPVLAPRLKVADLNNRSVMIHAGGDNYSDTPALGGGGARIACGTIRLGDKQSK